MSRLSATLRLDAQLQARNKVYLIIAVAAFGLAFALRALFTSEQLHFFMPLVALSGVTLTTFFLVGVLLLLERGEGTLDVVLVSPLRSAEYLASKLLTVTALALVESALIDAPRELKVRYGEQSLRVEYRVDGTLEARDFPLDGLAENAAFLGALREPTLETIHTQETSLERIFIRVTGRELA